MGQRAAIYVRVSTTDQSCERQIAELTAFAGRSGFAVLGIFKETGSHVTASSSLHRLAGSTRFWSRNCPGGAVQHRIFSIRSTSWMDGEDIKIASPQTIDPDHTVFLSRVES